MKIETTTYSVIKDVWEFYVWPKQRPIFPVDPQQYRSNIDNNIISKYSPTYFIIKKDNIIIGAIGGHRTTSVLYRVRGLFIDPDVEDKTFITNALLNSATMQAKKEGCRHLWNIINDDSVFESLGFERTEDLKDGRSYAIYPVTS